ncbi:hypothetical protein G6F22_019767 [Rhizopus arrhizus]|nr:hypothetical protein G6F22_019767 [Rhizopus arrhizus]
MRASLPSEPPPGGRLWPSASMKRTPNAVSMPAPASVGAGPPRAGGGAAHHAGMAPLGHDRHARRAAQAQHRRHFLGIRRARHGQRLPVQAAALVRQIRRGGSACPHPFLPQPGPQGGQQGIGDAGRHGLACASGGALSNLPVCACAAACFR